MIGIAALLHSTLLIVDIVRCFSTFRTDQSVFYASTDTASSPECLWTVYGVIMSLCVLSKLLKDIQKQHVIYIGHCRARHISELCGNIDYEKQRCVNL